jgi:hypothetical protein
VVHDIESYSYTKKEQECVGVSYVDNLYKYDTTTEIGTLSPETENYVGILYHDKVKWYHASHTDHSGVDIQMRMGGMHGVC